MNYIKVWCEYYIGGDFGANNDQTVFAVPEHFTEDDINFYLNNKYADMAEEEGCEGSLQDDDLMGWEYITINTLGE
jgi:hypothetical protein